MRKERKKVPMSENVQTVEQRATLQDILRVLDSLYAKIETLSFTEPEARPVIVPATPVPERKLDPVVLAAGPAEPPASGPIGSQSEPDQDTVVVHFVSEGQTKEGTNSNGPWTRFFFRDSEGDPFSVFDHDLANKIRASITSNKALIIKVNESRFGNKVTGILGEV